MIHGLYFEAYYAGFVSGHLKKQTNKQTKKPITPHLNKRDKTGVVKQATE